MTIKSGPKKKTLKEKVAGELVDENAKVEDEKEILEIADVDLSEDKEIDKDPENLLQALFHKRSLMQRECI